MVVAQDQEHIMTDRICAVTHCAQQAKDGHLICLRCQRTYEQVSAMQATTTTGYHQLGQSDEAFERALQLAEPPRTHTPHLQLAEPT